MKKAQFDHQMRPATLKSILLNNKLYSDESCLGSNLQKTHFQCICNLEGEKVIFKLLQASRRQFFFFYSLIHGHFMQERRLMIKSAFEKKACGRGRISTDLSRLIAILYYGYFTVWKFSNFPGTLISREINFG